MNFSHDLIAPAVKSYIYSGPETGILTTDLTCIPYTPNNFVPLIAISNLKDVQSHVEKPDGKKQIKLTTFLTKEEKGHSKVSFRAQGATETKNRSCR